MPAPKKPPGTQVGHRRHTVIHMARTASKPDAPPPAPKGLTKRASELWEEYWRSDVANIVDLRSDLGKLQRWITDVDEYLRAMKALKTARLVRGSTGQPALNPLAAYVAQLKASIEKAEVEFGMGPLSRLRLGIAVGEAAKSLDDMNMAFELQEGDLKEVEVAEVEIEDFGT